MSTLKIILGFILTAIAAGSIINEVYYDVSVLQINSRWNMSNSLKLDSLEKCNKTTVFYEDQPFSVQKSLPNLPVIIIYKRKERVAMYGGNMMLEPTVTIDSIQSVVNSLEQ